MRLLLDTCTFLWLCEDSPRLSAVARAAFRAQANEVMLSAVSTWEISVKHALGRLPLPQPPHHWVPAQREAHAIEPLPLTEEATLHAHRLPAFHADPFDRLLVCQALAEGLCILTPDAMVSQYPVKTLW